MCRKAVVQGEARDPPDVAFFGAQRVVADAQHLAHLIEQAGRPGLRQLPKS
jgi:hypothetical protein